MLSCLSCISCWSWRTRSCWIISFPDNSDWIFSHFKTKYQKIPKNSLTSQAGLKSNLKITQQQGYYSMKLRSWITCILLIWLIWICHVRLLENWLSGELAPVPRSCGTWIQSDNWNWSSPINLTARPQSLYCSNPQSIILSRARLSV